MVNNRTYYKNYDDKLLETEDATMSSTSVSNLLHFMLLFF